MTQTIASQILSVSVREDLREGNLSIGVDNLHGGGGDYVSFVNRPAIVASPDLGDAYIVLLEDDRLVVADSIDLEFGEVIHG
jgi:hypothetical protein